MPSDLRQTGDDLLCCGHLKLELVVLGSQHLVEPFLAIHCLTLWHRASLVVPVGQGLNRGDRDM